MPKIHNGWIDLIMKEIKCYKLFPHSLPTGNFFKPSWFKSKEAQKLKENKAKAVHCKAACHSEKHDNIVCKIKLKDIEYHIPVLYINIQGIKELCSEISEKACGGQCD